MMKGLPLRKNAQGFTLIELMIVVAIIGILAAVALPAYQNYTGKAQASEAVSIAASTKTAIAQYYQTEGAFPTATSVPSWDDLKVTGTYGELTVAASGVIQFKMNSNSVSADLKDGIFTLKPSIIGGAFKWTCTSNLTNASLNPKGCTKEAI